MGNDSEKAINFYTFGTTEFSSAIKEMEIFGGIYLIIKSKFFDRANDF